MVGMVLLAMCCSMTWVVITRSVCMFMCVVSKLYIYNLYRTIKIMSQFLKKHRSTYTILSWSPPWVSQSGLSHLTGAW